MSIVIFLRYEGIIERKLTQDIQWATVAMSTVAEVRIVNDMNLKPVAIWGIALVFCVQFIGGLGPFDPPPFHDSPDKPPLALLCAGKCVAVLTAAFLVHRWKLKKSKPN